jgi:hypothetical protein
MDPRKAWQLKTLCLTLVLPLFFMGCKDLDKREPYEEIVKPTPGLQIQLFPSKLEIPGLPDLPDSNESYCAISVQLKTSRSYDEVSVNLIGSTKTPEILFQGGLTSGTQRTWEVLVNKQAPSILQVFYTKDKAEALLWTSKLQCGLREEVMPRAGIKTRSKTLNEPIREHRRKTP